MIDLRALFQSLFALYGFGASRSRKRPAPIQIGRPAPFQGPASAVD